MKWFYKWARACYLKRIVKYKRKIKLYKEEVKRLEKLIRKGKR